MLPVSSIHISLAKAGHMGIPNFKGDREYNPTTYLEREERAIVYEQHCNNFHSNLPG